MTAMYNRREQKCQDFEVDLWSEFVSRHFFLGPASPKAYVHFYLLAFTYVAPHILNAILLLRLTPSWSIRPQLSLCICYHITGNVFQKSLCSSHLSSVLHALIVSLSCTVLQSAGLGFSQCRIFF